MIICGYCKKGNYIASLVLGFPIFKCTHAKEMLIYARFCSVQLYNKPNILSGTD